MTVLIHFPAIFAAIVASAIILTLSSAGGPIFQSSAGTAVIRSGIQDQHELALSVKARGVLASDIVSYQQRQLGQAITRIANLGAETTTLVGSNAKVEALPSTTRPARIRLLSRTGFLSHIQVVSRASDGTQGVWLPDSTALALHAVAGKTVTITKGLLSMTVPVAGIYRTLVGRVPPFWAPVSAAIYPSGADEPPPPPPLLADETEFLRITTELQDSGSYAWDFELAPAAQADLDLNTAKQVVGRIGGFDSRSHDLTTPIGMALQQPTVESPLSGLVVQATSAVNSIAGPIGTLSVTGAIVALVGVLAAAVYGIRRRRTEVRMLNAIGISWFRLGTRFAAEALPPLAIGAIVGWALANWLVRSLGPSSIVDADATQASLLAAAVGSAVAIVVFGLVAAAAGRIETEAASRGRLASKLSGAAWEVPILILAAAALYEITARGTAPIEGANGSVHIDRLFLLFPILFIAGFGGLAVRGLSRSLVRVRTRSTRWPVWLYFAARRLSSAPRVALLLVTASCLAVGILAYAGTVVSTIRAATLDKTMVAVGADVSASHGANLVLPPQGQPRALTRVISIRGDVMPAQHQANVLAIDPSTFAQTAFWDANFSSHSLPDLLRMLSQSSGNDVPTIVVNGPAAPASTLSIGGYSIPLRVVDSVGTFPGESRGTNLVVSAPVLRRILESHGVTITSVGASYRTWARGDSARAASYFKSLGISPQLIVSAAARLQAPDLRALSWAFGFMEVLGAMTALVALIGLVLYLQARQRGREMTYALSYRMGLSARAHLAAVAAELACILIAALVIGAVLAVCAASLVYQRLDPMPSLPPNALLKLPLDLLGTILLAIATSTVVGASIVQRQTQRVNVAEVMRFAD
ncbi:MAG: hypothetical protein M3P43_12130 [Actinomycetota bacterium]|nr:hypothetical protein [Actinomycetota bacterium]